MAQFRTILCDPPWAFKVWAKVPDVSHGRLSAAHYPTQEANWICSLPVKDIAETDCVLLLWATYPTLPEAFKVIESWGFTYKTVAFTWIKTTRDKTPSVGMGYWTRANAEICLLATRGKPKRINKDVRQVILSQRRKHSQKPHEQYERIERLLSGPFCEMFSRPDDGLFPPRPGWTFTGNAVDGKDMAVALREIALLPQSALETRGEPNVRYARIVNVGPAPFVFVDDEAED